MQNATNNWKKGSLDDSTPYPFMQLGFLDYGVKP